MTNIRNGSGAIGVFNLDTTKLTNGLHTIAWSVTDDHGRADGIGSRFFTVQNGASSRHDGERPRRGCLDDHGCCCGLGAGCVDRACVRLGAAAELAWRSASASDVLGRAGFDFDGPLEPMPADATGLRHVRMPELGRVELQLGDDMTAGYLRANDALQPLPPGSQLDPRRAPSRGRRERATSAPTTWCFCKARRSCPSR